GFRLYLGGRWGGSLRGCWSGGWGRGLGRTGQQGVHVFVLARDDRDELTDRSCIALADEALAQHAVAARDDLHDGLVGFHLGDRLAVLHGVALVLQPFDEAPF